MPDKNPYPANDFLKELFVGTLTMKPKKEVPAVKRIIYNNNPIDKWCLANTAYDEDKNGNIQPHKTSKSTRRIDGTAALLDAYTIYDQKQAEYTSML